MRSSIGTKRVLAGVLLLALGALGARADTLSTLGDPSPASLLTIEPDWLTGVGLITDFRFLPDGRCVVVTQDGTVLVRPAGGGPLGTAGSFPVDTANEKGLLGLAVHPEFAENGQLLFYYSASNAAGGTNVARQRIVMRTLDGAGRLSDGETPLVTGLAGPLNHNGGALDVGPDGYLYIGVGDTGCNSGTPPEPIYTPTNFFGTCLADHPTAGAAGNGKILRVALDGGIPPSNPLVGATDVTACGATCGEAIAPDRLGPPREDVWAWGFRNPFRLWVDPRTGLVWVGDVGEVAYEEITIAQAGRHHGWPWREGGRGHAPSQCGVVRIGTTVGGDPILDQDCVDPVYFCRHNPIADADVDANCFAITGGLIVDGCTWPDALRGRYVFGDNATRLLWTIATTPARDGVTGARADLGRLEGAAPVALRTGPDEALYVAALPGRIVRIAPARPALCAGACTTSAECDDGDPCTSDGCDAATARCRFAPIPACGTSTTTLPPDPCPGGCDDGDACTDDVCDGTCHNTPIPGAAGVACLCAAAIPTCAEGGVPAKIARRRARACAQVARVDPSAAMRRTRPLVRKAAKGFRRAAVRATRQGGRRGLADACRTALAAHLRDAAARTQAILPGGGR
ncbi:MAG: PQQ-dependent sugar dehydrogenase [bacterium]|nr:PQQ-dependent sugar dehydrogenase [bacterium]